MARPYGWNAACGAAIAAMLFASSCGQSSPPTVLEEAPRIDASTSPEFWLSSGALFFRGGGFGRTIQGDLPPEDKWRAAYERTNPSDTDDGRRPQNIFRLIDRAIFTNVRETLVFTIRRVDPSGSTSRNESNGVFLFSRYADANDLYVAGVRVDGAAVVKKKIGGAYFTLAIAPVFAGSYDRSKNPNLLPVGEPITIASDTVTNLDGTVDVALSVDGRRIFVARDDGSRYGGAPIRSGMAGIRSDFMDVEFDGYEARPE